MLVETSCTKCKGTGTIWSDRGIEGNVCGHCVGTGNVTVGNVTGLLNILNDLSDKVNDVMDKCNDIKEVVDAL